MSIVVISSTSQEFIGCGVLTGAWENVTGRCGTVGRRSVEGGIGLVTVDDDGLGECTTVGRRSIEGGIGLVTVDDDGLGECTTGKVKEPTQCLPPRTLSPQQTK